MVHKCVVRSLKRSQHNIQSLHF